MPHARDYIGELESLDRRLVAVASGSDAAALAGLARERSRVASEYAEHELREGLAEDILVAEELAALDPEWAKEAQALRDKLSSLDRQEVIIMPREACVLTVRAGVGGADAALFAAQLLLMYEGWADRNGWDYDETETAVGKLGLGIRHASLRVSGRGALTRLLPEAGVHRIQRVPETEARGRIHTSTATVSVLSLPEDGPGLLGWSDIRCDTFRSTGNGGQSVNTTDSAVRLVHEPTGTVATCSTKSQHRNKELAYGILCARVAAAEAGRRQAAATEERRRQVGDGSRSGRTRNYDIPEDLVVDYATGTRTPGVGRVLAGDLSPIENARHSAGIVS